MGLVFVLILFNMGVLLYVFAVHHRTKYDKVMAVSSFGTNVIVMLSLIAYLTKDVNILDIALLYACISFVSVIALLHFFTEGEYSHPSTARKAKK